LKMPPYLWMAKRVCRNVRGIS